MKYYQNLIIRLVLALIIAISQPFYFLFSKPTFYLSYLVTKFYNPIIIDNTIIINNIKLVFIPACTAASAYLLLALLILTTKDISFKKSIKIFIIGSLAILTANIIRILVLIIILVNLNYNTFQTIHLFFWKILSSIFVVILWIYLTKKYKIKTIPIYSDLKQIINTIK